MRVRLAPLVGGSLLLMATSAQALELTNNDHTTLNFDVSGTAAWLHSQESYDQAGTLDEGSVTWQEGAVKYGISGEHRLARDQRVTGALRWTSTGTWGDGDAAGFSDGGERTTKLEDAFLTWHSGALFPALGNEGLAVSAGRQSVIVGDGFLITSDSLNFGKGIADGALNRGGAYYLAGRSAFDKTAIISLGGEQGWRGDVMWLQSDNPAQAKPELNIGVLEHVNDKGTVGLTYVKVTDLDDEFAFLYPQRDDMETVSLRAQGNAGVENLFLAAEYAWQDQDQGDENAWYAELGWTFSGMPWRPSIHYRFSRFSTGYDPLLYGNGRALGTWFQGEVAANYAGPFNTNSRVHHLAATVTPKENLSLGLLAYDFTTLDRDAGADTSAREYDLYLEWAVNDHLALIPVIGLYQPDRAAADGGTQLGNDDRNLYSQLIVAFSF